MILEGFGEQIKVEDGVLAEIRQHVQTSASDLEAGGVLMGREPVDGALIVVDPITVPMPKDGRGRRFFERRDKGHLRLYERLNHKCNIYAYVGEWHTHSQPIPSPSGKDLSNWGRIRSIDDARSVQYHVIAGLLRIGFWSCGPERSDIRSIGSFDWGDLGL